MGKIATRSYCNQLKANSFQIDLNRGVSLSECLGAGLNVGGLYQNQQLIQEGDISAGYILIAISIYNSKTTKMLKLNKDNLSILDEKLINSFEVGDLCYGNRKIIGTSKEGNTFKFAISEDGFDWSYSEIDRIEDIRKIAFGIALLVKDRFVAVGNHRDNDRVALSTAYSSDGITWTKKEAPLNFFN